MFIIFCAGIFLAIFLVDGKPNATSLLASKKYCGYQHTDDYNRESFHTSLDEFPWLAALLYEYKGEYGFIKAAGSLINNNYVLTAAHAIMPPSMLHVALVGVRLGEYNQYNQSDCVTVYGYNECTDPVVEFGIEDKIVHPNYRARSSAYDIGLLRLNRSVSYSDYIRPICLPLSEMQSPKTGDVLITSGWGTQFISGKGSPIKKRMFVRLVAFEECYIAYNTTYGTTVTENNICTIGDKSNKTFSCQGDSGAPVMFSLNNQWYMEGIVSAGRGCDGRYPDIHMKVRKFIQWIIGNIKP